MRPHSPEFVQNRLAELNLEGDSSKRQKLALSLVLWKIENSSLDLVELAADLKRELLVLGVERELVDSIDIEKFIAGATNGNKKKDFGLRKTAVSTD